MHICEKEGRKKREDETYRKNSIVFHKPASGTRKEA